jgi:hypothetical protein
VSGEKGYRSGRRADLRIACAGLSGQRAELIVFGDVVGFVVVFPVAATAVLGLAQVAQLRAALGAYVDGRL